MVYLASLSSVLISTPYLAVGGVGSASLFDHAVMEMAKTVVGPTYETAAQPFPIEIGKLLIKKFGLINTKNTGFDKLMEVHGRTKEARKAIFALGEAVAAADKTAHATEVSERSRILREVWTSANAELKDMINKKNYFKEQIQRVSLSIMVTGPIVRFFHPPDQLSLLLDVANVAAIISSRTRIADRALDGLIKTKRPNHVQALYDLSVM